MIRLHIKLKIKTRKVENGKRFKQQSQNKQKQKVAKAQTGLPNFLTLNCEALVSNHPSIAPCGLTLRQADAYWGVCYGTFRKLMEEGIAPAPTDLGLGQLIFDRTTRWTLPSKLMPGATPDIRRPTSRGNPRRRAEMSKTTRASAIRGGFLLQPARYLRRGSCVCLARTKLKRCRKQLPLMRRCGRAPRHDLAQF